jgi:hypothetical protein
MGRAIGYSKRAVKNFGLNDAARPRVYTFQVVAPSKQVQQAMRQLEQAGFKIGPGVNLKSKP